MGDQAGGSGWEIPTADGGVEKFYVDIPGDIATFEVHLPDAPATHKGKAIRDKKIQTLAQLYFDYLGSMLSAALKTFGAQGA
jgi:hypothetical protein